MTGCEYMYLEKTKVGSSIARYQEKFAERRFKHQKTSKNIGEELCLTPRSDDANLIWALGNRLLGNPFIQCRKFSHILFFPETSCLKWTFASSKSGGMLENFPQESQILLILLHCSVYRRASNSTVWRSKVDSFYWEVFEFDSAGRSQGGWISCACRKKPTLTIHTSASE